MSLPKVFLVAGFIVGLGGFIISALVTWCRLRNYYGNSDSKIKGPFIAMIITALGGILLFALGIIIGGATQIR